MEEESTALVPMGETVIEAPTVHLVARNPTEMDAARADLASWLNLKLASIEAEVKDLNASINEARTNEWKTDALTRTRNKAVSQETYYFKMLKAVEAGYMIIPEFPIDVFAIRVTRGGPRAGENTSTSLYGYPRIDHERPDTAPAGEGSYKNPIQMVYRGERKETQNDKEVTVRYTRAASFQDEIVFPLQAARPLVMDATGDEIKGQGTIRPRQEEVRA